MFDITENKLKKDVTYFNVYSFKNNLENNKIRGNDNGCNSMCLAIDKFINKKFGYGLNIIDNDLVNSFFEADNYINYSLLNELNFKIIYSSTIYLVNDDKFDELGIDIDKDTSFIDNVGLEYKTTTKMEKALKEITEWFDPISTATILVKNKTGLKNLYKLHSIANLKYKYNDKPIILKSIFKKYSAGLLIGSGNYTSEIYNKLLHKVELKWLLDDAINSKNENEINDVKKMLEDFDSEIEEDSKLYDFFEIQPISYNMDLLKCSPLSNENDLKEINREIIELAQKSNKLVIATGCAQTSSKNM